MAAVLVPQQIGHLTGATFQPPISLRSPRRKSFRCPPESWHRAVFPNVAWATQLVYLAFIFMDLFSQSFAARFCEQSFIGRQSCSFACRLWWLVAGLNSGDRDHRAGKAYGIHSLPSTGVFYCSSWNSVLRFPFGVRVVFPGCLPVLLGGGGVEYGWGGTPPPAILAIFSRGGVAS